MSYEYITGPNLIKIMEQNKNLTNAPEFIALADTILEALKQAPGVLAHFFTEVQLETLEHKMDIIDQTILYLHIGIMFGVKLTELKEEPQFDYKSEWPIKDNNDSRRK